MNIRWTARANIVPCYLPRAFATLQKLCRETSCLYHKTGSTGISSFPAGRVIAAPMAIESHQHLCFCSLNTVIWPRNHGQRHHTANRRVQWLSNCIAAKHMWLRFEHASIRASSLEAADGSLRQSTCMLVDIACLWRAFA